MHELRSGLRFSAETLGHFGVASEVRMENLEHNPTRQLDLLGHIDLGHSAAAESMKHPIAIAGGATKARDLFGRLLERRTRELWQRIGAANADRRRRSIPSTTLRTEHSVSRIAC
jgi:hypothetical protein